MAARNELTIPSTPTETTISRHPERIRTVVADDSDTFLEVVWGLLDLEKEIRLIAASSDGVDAVDTVARLRPELVVMDVTMPGMNGLAASALMRTMSPAPIVVLMSSNDTPLLRAACQRAGAFAFVRKINFRNEFAEVLGRILKIRSAHRETTESQRIAG
jgi:CheY-like chemotaxis protein